jgi:hypothetical protein
VMTTRRWLDRSSRRVPSMAVPERPPEPVGTAPEPRFRPRPLGRDLAEPARDAGGSRDSARRALSERKREVEDLINRGVLDEGTFGQQGQTCRPPSFLNRATTVHAGSALLSGMSMVDSARVLR